MEDKKGKNLVIVIILILIMILALAIGVVIGCNYNSEDSGNYNNEHSNNYSNAQSNNCNEENRFNNKKNKANVTAKPIIYLYPKETMQMSIKLGKAENLTCTYPKYEGEWNVIANPNGNLIDTKTGRNLYSLYWEGKNSTEFNTQDGFVIKGADTVKFLEEKLKILGLTDREAEEFIIYWLPQMENNNYNYIRFCTMDEINEDMPLEFSVNPDSLIRVLMIFEPLDEYKEVPEQKLITPKRVGFVAVEWGGLRLSEGTIK